MKHLECNECGVILECDWLGLALDYDDECKITNEYHHRIEVNCDCELHVRN